jgi:uncharacterized protein YfaS (alpha-2-macroglobulin family)
LFSQIPSDGFPESDSQKDQHVLRVTGSGGLTFNVTELHSIMFDKKGFTVYVQTDKGIYKPGQTGKFC